MGIAILTETDKESLKMTNVWSDNCPVPIERLRRVTVSYFDFEGQEHDDGQITVFDVIAEVVESIFIRLKEMKFPLSKVRSMHEYNGDDELAMADNNSSCFNCREIAQSQFLSLHSYGLAIDINPVQNPYLIIDDAKGLVEVHPKAGWQYLNRRNHKSGMVESLEELFASHGFFIWGGMWTTPIDYHHFQVGRGMAELLASMSYEDGFRLFGDKSLNNRELASNLVSGHQLMPLIELYKADKSKFFDQSREQFQSNQSSSS